MTALGEVADFEMGQAPPGSECNTDGIGTLFVKAGEFGEQAPIRREWTTRPLKFGRTGDVFICVVGATAGKLNLGIDCAIGRSVAAIRPSPTLDTKFLYYQLQPWVLKLRAASAGSAQGVIAKKQLAEIPVVVPAVIEQRRIVAELEKQLSRLDEAVTNLKRVKANLKRQTAAILSAAIGGRLLERAVFPGDADRPEFAPDIKLPPGWPWASSAEVCDAVASGSTPKAEEMTSGAGEVPFIKVYNLGFDGSLDFTVKPTFIRRAIHEGPLARSRCLPGDVLMNIVGPPLGKVSLVPDAFPEWNINQAIVTFRAGPRILNRLLAYWLMAPPVQRRIERTAKATAGQYNVQVSTCRKLVLPLPPLDEQHRIVAEVDRRLSIVREVEAEVDANLKRAQSLRQSVLARAFAG